MADIIGEGVIKVSADASGFSAGMAKAKADADAFQNSASQMSRTVGSAMSAAFKAHKDAINSIGNVTNDFGATLAKAFAKSKKEAEDLAKSVESNMTKTVQSVKGANESIKKMKAESSPPPSPTSAPPVAPPSKQILTDSGEKMSAIQARYISALRTKSLTAGLDPADAAQARAAFLNISEAANPYIQKLREASIVHVRTGKTAKEMQAAMRLVPAQMTDIVTSLASGMPVWLVAIQQGGQLKDSFGGLAPMFRVLIGLLTPVKLLIGGVAAVALTLGVAFYESTKEITAYVNALTMSGNAIGLSVGQLREMATEIGKTGTSQGLAAEALAALAAGGMKVDSSNLQKFAKTAADLERTAGIPIKETAKAMALLADDPVKGSQKLTAEFGYLDLATLQTIRSLQEQGRTLEAVNMAQKAFSDAMARRTQEMKDQAGGLAKAWEQAYGVVISAYNSIKNFAAGPTTEQKIAVKEQRLAAFKADTNPFVQAFTSSQQKQLADEIAALKEGVALEKKSALAKGEATRAQQDAIEADEYRQKLLKENWTWQQKRDHAERDYWNQYAKLEKVGKAPTPEQASKEIGWIREHYKPSGGGGGGSENAADKMIRDSKAREESLREQYALEDKILASEKALAKFNSDIAYIKTEKTLTASQKQLLAAEATIRKQLEGEVDLERALDSELKMRELIKKKIEETTQKEKEFHFAVKESNEAMTVKNEERRYQYSREFEGLGKGDREKKRINEENALYREYAAERAKLEKDAIAKGTLGSEDYEKGISNIEAQLARALKDHQDYYAKLKQAQADWSIGAGDALANYMNAIENVAEQTAKTMSSAFSNMEDSLTEFLSTGKLDFKKFVDSLISDVNRMIVKKFLMQPLSSLIDDMMSGVFKNIFGQGSQSSGGGGTTWGGIGNAISGLFGGSGGAAASSMAELSAPLLPLAKGGAFGASGRVQAFGAGGVVDRPTLFRYGGSAHGVMGEAGYEGILPLARGADGKLGVSLNGKKSDGGTVINFNVTASDAQSFSRSESQIQAMLARSARLGKRNL